MFIKKLSIIFILFALTGALAYPSQAQNKKKSKKTRTKKHLKKKATQRNTVPEKKLKTPPTIDHNQLFDHKKYMLNPQKNYTHDEVIRHTTSIGVGAALTTGMYYTFARLDPINSFSTAIFSAILGKMIIDPVKKIGKKAGIFLFPFMVRGSAKKIQHYQKIYQKRKQYLTKSMQGFFEGWIERYRYLVEERNYEARELENALEEILHFPLFPKKVTVNFDAMKTFLAKYPDDVKRTIGSFVVNTLEDSQVLQLHKRSTPLMFVGPPGTGKTYLAQNLGKLLDMPVQVIDLSRYQNISGGNFWSQGSEKGILVDILQSTNKKEINPANKILVLDEIDKVLALDDRGSFVHPNGAAVMALLHHLLEAHTVEMPLKRYENAKYNIGHLKIILIGNKTFTEVLGSRASALESRLHLIRFDDGFKKDKKRAIVQSYLDTLLKKYALDRAVIEDQIIEQIIAEDENCGIKGVRILLSIIDRYINYVKNQTLIAKISGVSCPTFDVAKAYAQYQPTLTQEKKQQDKKTTLKKTIHTK